MTYALLWGCAAAAVATAAGRPVIAYLRARGLGKAISSEGPQSHMSKAGTPTMGGLLVFGVALGFALIAAVPKDADVLLVPVGGGTTLDASAAAEVVSQLEPRIVIPMYYGTPGQPLESVERFCSELAVTDTTVQPRLQVTRNSLPDETRVVLLASPEPKR